MSIPFPPTRAWLVAGSGTFLQAVSGWWDVFSHRRVFAQADPWWNPAHVGLYIGTGLVLLGLVWWRRREPSSGTMGDRRLPTYNVVLTGAAVQIGGGVLNEFIHRFPTLENSPWHFSAHGLFTGGMLLAALGVGGSVLLTCRAGATAPFSWRIPFAALVLGASAFWLTSAGAVLYTVGRGAVQIPLWLAQALLAFLASLLVTAILLTLSRFGAATLVWLVFSGAVYLLLVGYLGLAPYVPWGLIVVLAVEAGYFLLRKRHGPVLGLAWLCVFIGGFTVVLYFPLTDLGVPSVTNLLLNLGAAAIGVLSAWSLSLHPFPPRVSASMPSVVSQ